MLSVIMVATGDPAKLAKTLASIVPAIPQGVVRDGWILSEDERHETQRIADSAGCDYHVGPIAETFPMTARRCASDWLLVVEAGLLLEEGWWREAAEFVETVSGEGSVSAEAATFSHVVSRYGIAPRCHEWLVAVLAHLPFLRLRQRALIVRRNLIADRAAVEFPLKLGFAPVVLRAAAIAP